MISILGTSTCTPLFSEMAWRNCRDLICPTRFSAMFQNSDCSVESSRVRYFWSWFTLGCLFVFDVFDVFD